MQLTIAPDRHAVVLRGEVPTIDYRHAAYEAAKNYLYASSSQASQPVSRYKLAYISGTVMR